MSNLFSGLQADAINIKYTMIALFQHPLVEGFLLGIAASTIIHMVIVAEDPRTIPCLLARKPHHAFSKIYHKTQDQVDEAVYNEFLKTYKRVNLLFYITVILFLLVMLLSIFTI